MSCMKMLDTLVNDIIEDYKTNRNSTMIDFFMKNEHVPFGYCEKVYNAIGSIVSENVIESMIGRSDCPKEMIVRALLCTNEKLDYTRTHLFDIVYSGKPCWMMHEIVYRLIGHNGWNKTLCKYMFLDENIQRVLMDSIAGNSMKRTYIKIRLNEIDINTFCDFIKSQISIPEDRWWMVSLVENAIRESFDRPMYLSNYYVDGDAFKEVLKHIEFMKIPFDEDTLDEQLDDNSMENVVLILKLLMNPSISEYTITQLLVRIMNDEILEIVNKFVDEGKERRKEYKKAHETEVH